MEEPIQQQARGLWHQQPEAAPAPAATLSRAADRATLKRLDAEIAELDAQLLSLHAQRNVVHARLGEYRYPIHTLPNEILSEIFEQYLPPYPLCPPLLGDGSPTQLTHVCRRWWSVAHHNPRLWRCIWLEVEADDGSGSPTPRVPESLDIARTWLKRSQPLLLSLELGCDFAEARGGHPSIASWQHEALALFLQHYERWQSVALRLPDPHLDHFATPWPSSMDMPHLIDFRFISNFGEEALEMAGTSIAAPQLRTLEIRLARDTLHLSILKPESWSALTSLRLNDISPISAASVLRHTPALIYCYLDFEQGEFEDSDDDRESPEDLLLSSLKTLVLESTHGGDPADWASLRDSLVVPKLRRLASKESLFPGTSRTNPHAVPKILRAMLRAWTAGSLEEIRVLAHPDRLDEELRQAYRVSLPDSEVRSIEHISRDGFCAWEPGRKQLEWAVPWMYLGERR
ncbi:Ubiquitin family protein [Mycena chlorophos]|uniref:Ubiquitin family protein n=1 Tax=Mycena chlorophos TaxID=658473 RepID=A0A8H6S523_MYCCL|nr:Ubiquitin family protein [Mycena chlorophos]